MSLNMEKKYMINPASAGYGHRLWLSIDDFEMVAKLKEHSMWHGIDKRYRDDNGREIVSYEITPYDDGVTLDKIREILREDGFAEFTSIEDKMLVFNSFSRHF